MARREAEAECLPGVSKRPKYTAAEGNVAEGRGRMWYESSRQGADGQEGPMMPPGDSAHDYAARLHFLGAGGGSDSGRVVAPPNPGKVEAYKALHARGFPAPFGPLRAKGDGRPVFPDGTPKGYNTSLSPSQFGGDMTKFYIAGEVLAPPTPGGAMYSPYLVGSPGNAPRRLQIAQVRHRAAEMLGFQSPAAAAAVATPNHMPNPMPQNTAGADALVPNSRDSTMATWGGSTPPSTPNRFMGTPYPGLAPPLGLCMAGIGLSAISPIRFVGAIRTKSSHSMSPSWIGAAPAG